jgi:hypothetical protein
LIWRGTAQRQYDDDTLFSSAEKQRQQIYNMVAKILNNFPPPKE